MAEACTGARRISPAVWDLQFSPTYGGWIDPDEEEPGGDQVGRFLLARAVADVAKLHPDVDFHARTVKASLRTGSFRRRSTLSCWLSSGTVTRIWPDRTRHADPAPD